MTDETDPEASGDDAGEDDTTEHPAPRERRDQLEEEVVEGEVADDPDRRVVGSHRRFHSGPLPPPEVLREYNEVVPGLAREIVDQWKGETAHRHQTLDRLASTDREAMLAYYAGEKRGQILATLVVMLVVGIAALAVVLHSVVIGIGALVSAGAAAGWAVRRSTSGPPPPPESDEGEDGRQGDEEI